MSESFIGVLSASEFTGFPPETLEAALDDAWSSRSLATDRACRIYAARILNAVQQHIPDATTVVLREDTSHLPPHGHVDAILTQGNENVISRLGDWHDLEWTSNVDEDVWDIYHLAPHLFTRNGTDEVRRLTLTSAELANETASTEDDLLT